MCGITAIFSSQQQSDGLISSLHKVLLHRGPDYQNFKHLDLENHRHLYLLHNRLSIVDLTNAGHQPMYDETTGVYLIFNGEIYNFREIRQVLETEGFIFQSNTDSEVLLKGYIHWGKDIVQKLNGMFAFIVWDSRAQKMFIARDRFGEKPLYYGKSQNGDVIFSSEIKAILSVPGFECAIDYQVLDEFLLGLRSSSRTHLTPFKNILQVPPATCFDVSSSGEIINSYRFWSAHRGDWEGLGKVNDKDLYEEFLFLLRKSVKDRANCDVQLGSCLSGGLDSTSIVGIALKENLNNFSSTISVCYEDDPTISENNYLHEASNYFKGNHVFIEPTGAELLNNIEKLFWHQEFPVPSASMFLEWSVMKKARELKNIVMLDGQGADELLGGYPYYFKLYQNEILHGKKYKDLIVNTYLFRKFLNEVSSNYADAERRISLGVSYSFGELGGLFCRNTIKHFIGSNKSKNLQDLKKTHQSFTWMIEEGLSKTILQEQLHSADRNGMAFGVETRFPFLDYDLVDFSLKIPLKYLISHGMQKYVLRKAMHGIIPEKIRLRKDKLGFLAPQDTWLKGALKDWSFNMMNHRHLMNLPSYNKKKALETFSKFHKDPTNNLSNQVWRLASLGQWFSIFGGNQ